MNKKTNSFSISESYVKTLIEKGEKINLLLRNVNNNSRFFEGINALKHASLSKTEFKAEHILMFDFLQIITNYKNSLGKDQELNSASQFIILFLYELIQGSNLLKKYSLDKINQLIESKRFKENIEIILSTVFFKSNTEQLQYILPSTLKKINSTEAKKLNQLYIELAELLVLSQQGKSSLDNDYLENLKQELNNTKVNVDMANYQAVAADDTLEKVMAELNELIGLHDIKKTIADLINFLKVQKIRDKKGLKTTTNSLHAVFMGPPGTGKTTVARLLGRIFKHLGYLEKGHLIETDRAGMVAGYVGQTALKTDEIINSALGGVLFIDEAYALSSRGINDFGNEAVETLLKRMEDHRNQLVVVVAGYPNEMETFIESNPGLKSRFNRYLDFKQFSAIELVKIFEIISKKNDFILSEDAKDKVLEIFERVCEKNSLYFGNARSARNLFEKTTENQANRVVKIKRVSKKILMTILDEDVPPILKTVDKMIHI